jgi:hypothetical protein
MRTLRRMVVAATATGLMLVPGAASARDSDAGPRRVAPVPPLETRCLDAIRERDAALDRLRVKIDDSPGPHDAALVAIVNSAKTGLIVLQAAIEDPASEASSRKADCRRIVTDLRIYSLRVPQINLVVTLDELDHAFDELARLQDQLGDGVEAAAADGEPDAVAAREELARLEDTLAGARAKIDTIDVEALLAVTPRSYHTDKKVLRLSLLTMREVRRELDRASASVGRLAQLT